MSTEQTLTYPHIVALWTLVQHNPVTKLRELRQLLRALWDRPGKPPQIKDIPADLLPYLTQSVSLRTLRAVYGESMVKQMENGEIPFPADMNIPDAIIIGRVRPSFDEDEFKDHLILGGTPPRPRSLVRQAEWREGQSTADAEQAFMKAAEALLVEFRTLSDNQAAAAGSGVTLMTYCHLPVTAEPLMGSGFQVRMEFRQVTRLGDIDPQELEYEVVSEIGKYPISVPHQNTLMAMTKKSKDITLHNPFRDGDGNHIIKGTKAGRGPVLLDVSKES